MRRILSGVAAVMAVALTLAGCSDSGTMRDGSMTMLLTDAPGDAITAAVVTIDEVYLQSGGDSTDAGGRVVLSSGPTTVNLSSLVNTAESLFANVTVPGGDYAQLRFVISGAYIEVDQGDGTTKIYASSPDYAGLPSGTTVDGALQMPSFSTSGLKVNVPPGILNVDGDNTTVLVDFDVSQSFGHGAGPDTWVMHPVIRGAEFATAGSVQGSVTLGAGVVLDTLVIPALAIQLGSETQALVSVGGSFQYDFNNVLPGSYELKLVAPAGVTLTTAPATPMSVTVTSGATTTADLVITGIN